MKIWVDDERKPPEGWEDWKWVKSSEEAKSVISEHNDRIEAISLDHDLGENVESGYDLAKWLSKNDKWPQLVNIHTANSVGRDNIEFEARAFQRHRGIIKFISSDKPYLR